MTHERRWPELPNNEAERDGEIPVPAADDALQNVLRRNREAHEVMTDLAKMGIFGQIDGGAVRWTTTWGAGLTAPKLRAIKEHNAGIKDILIAAERDRCERTAS